MSRLVLQIPRRFFSRKCDQKLRIIGSQVVQNLEGGLTHNTSPSEQDFIQIASHPKGVLGYHVSETGYYPAFSFRNPEEYAKLTFNPGKTSLVPSVIDKGIIGLCWGLVFIFALRLGEVGREVIFLTTTAGCLTGLSSGISKNEENVRDSFVVQKKFLYTLQHSTPLTVDLEEHRKRIINSLSEE